MRTYALRPFRHVEGPALSEANESLLAEWTELNRQALVDFWDGSIEYTEDLLNAFQRLK